MHATPSHRPTRMEPRHLLAARIGFTCATPGQAVVSMRLGRLVLHRNQRAPHRRAALGHLSFARRSQALPRRHRTTRFRSFSSFFGHSMLLAQDYPIHRGSTAPDLKPARVCLRYSVGLRYAVDGPAEFLLNIHAARTARQRIVDEIFEVSPPRRATVAEDPATGNRIAAFR